MLILICRSVVETKLCTRLDGLHIYICMTCVCLFGTCHIETIENTTSTPLIVFALIFVRHSRCLQTSCFASEHPVSHPRFRMSLPAPWCTLHCDITYVVRGRVGMYLSPTTPCCSNTLEPTTTTTTQGGLSLISYRCHTRAPFASTLNAIC
jgi:hypothetical protein